MTTKTLTERQQHERDEYNARAATMPIAKVDLDHFAHKRFGPWSPYWTVFDFVRSKYPPPEHKLLNYGCGTGSSALIYANLGYTVWAFDIAEGLIDIARRSAQQHGLGERTIFSAQPAESLDYDDDSFDIVVGEDVLHHVELARALPELYRVLKPGGAAIFKDSLATPIRDSIRRRPPISWLLPYGTKNRLCGKKYIPTPDEHPLTESELALMFAQFPKMEVKRFHVLALLAKIFSNRAFFERCDWAMFRIFPFLRRFGDNIVIILKK